MLACCEGIECRHWNYHVRCLPWTLLRSRNTFPSGHVASTRQDGGTADTYGKESRVTTSSRTDTTGLSRRGLYRFLRKRGGVDSRVSDSILDRSRRISYRRIHGIYIHPSVSNPILSTTAHPPCQRQFDKSHPYSLDCISGA